jgi:uroporphyrinogen-III decarboxylase
VRARADAVADPREGVAADGTIVTGADRSRVPAAFEPFLCVQGNLDPQFLVAGGPALRAEADRILRALSAAWPRTRSSETGHQVRELRACHVSCDGATADR